MKRVCGILIALAWLVPLTGSQIKTVEPDGRTILEYVKILAADGMEGRGSGLPGLEKAAAYVAGLLKSWGIEPAGEKGTYFQRFPLKDFFVVEPGASLAVMAAGVKRTFYNQPRNAEWRVSSFSGSAKLEEEIVFVGYGLRAPQAGYDDYAGMDINGKIVLMCLGGAPRRADLGSSVSPQSRIRAAQELGARAVIICPKPPAPGQAAGAGSYPAGYYGDPSVHKKDFAIVGVTEKILNFIFDGLPMDANTIFDQLDAPAAKPRSFATGIRAALDIRTRFDPDATAVNVLGRISGSDKKLGEETVLLGAHLDGLGLAAEGDVMNGADDNASGSAVVLETARLLKANNVKLKRTVAFALWGGEEIGLLGSDHFATHPLFRLDKTVAYLNLDMVGQGGGKFQFGGVYQGPEIWDFLKKNLSPAVLEDLVPAASGGGSDQISFVAQGVPGFHLVGTRPHFKGHHPHDDVELIQPDLLARSSRFLYQAAQALAQADGGLIPPHRQGWVLFRNDTVVNCRSLLPPEILAKSGTEKYPDVDFQLVRLEEKAGLPPAELEVDFLKQLRDLDKALVSKSDLRIYTEDPTDLMRAGSRTRLLLGIEGGRAVRTDPGVLVSLARLGIKWIILGEGDLAGTAGKLSEDGLRVLQAAQEAGILVILNGCPDGALKDVLAAAARPMVVVADRLPSPEELDLMKAKRTCLALKFEASADLNGFVNRLKAAVEALGPGKAAVWNVDDLWTRPAKEAMVRLIARVFPEAWGKSQAMTSIYDTRGLPGILAGALVMTLREASQPAGR
jgi:hypothetical protein